MSWLPETSGAANTCCGFSSPCILFYSPRSLKDSQNTLIFCLCLYFSTNTVYFLNLLTISLLIYLHLPEKAIKVRKSEDSNNLPFVVVKACSLRQKYQYNSYVYFVEQRVIIYSKDLYSISKG